MVNSIGKSALFTLAAALFTLAVPRAEACTNVIVSKGASADGSVLVSYAADSHYLFGELYFHPAADWKDGTMLKVHDWDTGKYLLDIPQAAHTFKTVGNMNEHQLIIGETTWGGREELVDRTGGIDYGSLIYITLQRARTAREAIDIIVDLATKYGYSSEGETFSIADKNEAWIMELCGKGMNMKNGVNINKGIVWVARRVPDGAICAHANQARIDTFPMDDPDNCLYSKDIITFARKQGFFEGPDSEFSFRKAYNPFDFGTVRACDARAWSACNILCNGWFTYRDADGAVRTDDAATYLDYVMGYDLEGSLPLFVYPNKKVTAKDVADVMRDHFEGTPMDMTQDIGAGGNALPYRWRPMEFESEGKTYINERAIATQQTGFWFVAQARGYYPDIIGGIIWFGTDDAATSYLTPIYTCVDSVPECFREGNGDLLHYSPTASFWMNNRVANACYKMYNIMAPTVRAEADLFELEQMTRGIRTADSTAIAIYNGIVEKIQKKMEKKSSYSMVSGDPFSKVRKYLTKYSTDTAQSQFRKWTELEELLLVKYIDGNVKPQAEDGSFLHSDYSTKMPKKVVQPGYTKIWKDAVAREHGNVIEVK
ncbi:MAG: C69 family dipeptidase [Bacteroidales bacterium]|nr:C69 family dipeptidase [Bacteroidales bacterium]